jgi:hypothetical protein
MPEAFAGSDGSFVSAWQLWKRRSKEYGSFALAQGETMVFRTTAEDGRREYVWYIGIEQEDLPDGIEIDGLTVRDERSE